MVQNIYSEMHLVSCTNTHCDVTDLVYHKMIKSIKTWIPWEWNITFLWNKKILDLCLRWHILKSCCFVAEVTFKCSGNIMLYQFHDWPMKHIPKHKSNHQFNCSLFTNLEKVLKTMYRENHWYLSISLEYLKMEWLTKFHSSERRMQEHLFMPLFKRESLAWVKQDFLNDVSIPFKKKTDPSDPSKCEIRGGKHLLLW